MRYENEINVTKQLLLAFAKASRLQMPYTHLSHTNNDQALWNTQLHRSWGLNNWSKRVISLKSEQPREIVFRIKQFKKTGEIAQVIVLSQIE